MKEKPDTVLFNKKNLKKAKEVLAVSNLKVCAYPDCKNICRSRGKNSITGISKRFRWCTYHRTGKGRTERTKLFPPDLQEPNQ